MSQYILRRLLIAIPSLLGISLVLFTVLALAPGDPFSELATNPNVPPEVGLALRAKFGLDDPIYLRYLHWLVAMAQGDWGFSFVSRMNVDTLILQRLPTTLYVIGSAQLLGASDCDPGRRLCRHQALFDIRPGRQHARLHRLFAADLLHRHPVHPDLFGEAGLVAVRLSTDIKATGMALARRADPAGDHAGHGARPVPGGVDDPLRALGHAGRDPPRLRHHRPRQGPRAERGSSSGM